MRGRSIGSKRINARDAAPRPTRASSYQEDHTPHEWTAPNELSVQLAPPRRRRELHTRALRHGLIASQLGLPMRARDEASPASQWGAQPAAESNWQPESYTVEDAYAAYSGETDVSYNQPYNEPTTYYDEWELQKELVTYEETYPGYEPSYEQAPPIDLQLPAIASAYEHDYGEPAQQAPSPGSYPYAAMASHKAQPSAARWQAQEPIRHSASAIQTAHPGAQEALRYNAAPSRSLPARGVRRADDEPVAYPHKRSWLKLLLLVVALAGAGYASHHYYTRRAPAPAAPPPAATITTPEPPAAITAPEVPIPTPVLQLPQESAKARRSAARAALIAERRERRAARRSRGDVVK